MKTATKKKILFVDDEKNVRSALQRSFQREGYEIAFAKNGEEALQLLLNNPVHLLVSDNKMPKMSGVDLVKKVKAIHPETHCMMLTGFEDPALATPQVSRCVEKVIQKPWDDRVLKDAIEECLLNKVQETEKPAIAPRVPSPVMLPEDETLDPTGTRIKPRRQPRLMAFDLASSVAAVGIAAWLVVSNQTVPVPPSYEQGGLGPQLERIVSRMDELQSLGSVWAAMDVGQYSERQPY